jgi:hypothetical protein
MLLTLIFLDAIDYTMKLQFLMFGFHVNPANNTQNTPILATSLNDFWSLRWNYLVQKLILKRYIYDPLRFGTSPHEYHLRKRVDKPLTSASFAAFMTFLFSGLWHALPIFAVYGLWSYNKPLDLNNDGSIEDEPWYGAFYGTGVVAFFILQYLGIVLEKEFLHVEKWSMISRRIWTGAFITFTYPLMAYPFMTLCGLTE